MLLLLSACSTQAMGPTPEPTTTLQAVTITIGDISDEPKKKIDRFQPLADYLAANLKEFGYNTGRVMIASSLEEMVEMIEGEQVDVYIDSPFPSLTTQAAADTQLILRRWKDGDALYRGVIITAFDSPVRSPRDMRGKVIAAEEPYSTSGFASQAIDLIAAGYELEVVASPNSPVSAEALGVWFSRDEENTVEAVLNGTVQAGFVSDQDLAAIPDTLRSRIRVLTESDMLPRQVVSIRGGLGEEVTERIRDLLLGLEETPEGRKILDQIKTVRFDAIPPEDRQRLSDFADNLILLP